MAKKKEEARTSYTVLPDPNGQLAVMAARIIERTAQIDALDGALALGAIGDSRRGPVFDTASRARYASPTLPVRDELMLTRRCTGPKHEKQVVTARPQVAAN
jgi:hypothetical protein